MIQLDPLNATLAGLILAIWLAAAVVAVTFGWRRHNGAKAAVAELGRLRLMLAGAPALPILVSADGRLRARKIEAGGKRMPGGVMSAQAADDMQHLVDALYAPSRLMVIERAVGEARQRLKSKGKL